MKHLFSVLFFILLSINVFSQAGALDESFDPGYGTDNIFCSSITQILLLDDNRILLSGEYTYFDSIISRNLTMVDSLGNKSSQFSTGQGALGHIEGMELLSNGDIFVFGELYSYNGVDRNGIARIKPNGNLVSSFVPTSSIDFYVQAAESLSTGKLVISDSDEVMRLHSNGSRDNIFPSTIHNNITSSGSSSYSSVESIVSQGSKLLLGGDFNRLDDTYHSGIGRLNSNGTIDNTFQSGAGFDRGVRKIKVLDDNKIMVVGRFTSYDGNMCNGIARLNSDGSFDDSFISEDGFNEWVNDIVIMDNGQMLVVGEFTSYQGVSVGGIVRLNPDGSIDDTFLSADGISDSECSFSDLKTVAENTLGDIYIGGFFNNYNSIPRRNIAKLFGSCNSSNAMSEVTVIECGLVDLNGITYTESGIYNATLSSSYGCDSLVQYDISILPIVNQGIDVEICSGSSYNNHTSSGIYEDVFVAVNGCDSVVTVNLTVTEAVESLEQIVICDGEEYQGFSVAGVYSTMGVDSNGCDIVQILELSVLDNSIMSLDESICAGDTLFGYFESGVYEMILDANNGCDSTVILDLTVKELVNSNIDISICQGESYEGYTNEGIYVDTYNGSAGCDSIRTLTLSVFSTINTTVDMDICEGEIYNNYSISGIYVDTFIAEMGCDSIRTLNLTVLSNSFSESSITICDDGTSESGIYETIVVAANGCDSIIIVDVTVIDLIETVVVDTICQGEDLEGYETSGSYEDVFTDINGCDSTRTLILTVLPLDHIECDPLSNKYLFLNSIKIYPNPSNGTFSIVGFNETEKLVHLSLFDLRNNYLFDIDMNELSNVNLPELEGGVYILRFKYRNGEIGFKKIIVL